MFGMCQSKVEKKKNQNQKESIIIKKKSQAPFSYEKKAHFTRKKPISI
jgi:hypothetical protein